MLVSCNARISLFRHFVAKILFILYFFIFPYIFCQNIECSGLKSNYCPKCQSTHDGAYVSFILNFSVKCSKFVEAGKKESRAFSCKMGKSLASTCRFVDSGLKAEWLTRIAPLQSVRRRRIINSTTTDDISRSNTSVVTSHVILALSEFADNSTRLPEFSFVAFALKIMGLECLLRV